jgi:sigma-E factor negative regulatory protein RseA
MMKISMTNESLKKLSELQAAQISDLADGQLRDDDFAQAMTLMNDNSHARAYWHSLHLVGDVLRAKELASCAKELASCAKDAEFLNTFRAKLSLESKLAGVTPVNLPTLHVAAHSPKSTPANEPFFSWKWAAGLSALAASVILGLNLVGTTSVAPTVTGSQLAQSTAPISVEGQTAVMLRNPQLDALIAAHSQVGGSSAFQMPSGFLRSATFNATAMGDK